MGQRIMAAWKVLRGEWVAGPPVPKPSVWVTRPEDTFARWGCAGLEAQGEFRRSGGSNSAFGI